MDLATAWEIGRIDGVGQAEAVAKRELSASELVDAAILRVEALDDGVNAISWRAFDGARVRAAQFDATPVPGPLAGVPYLLKDSLDYPGMPSIAASRVRSPVPATRSYPLARAYDEAGLIPIGKSTMPEFALLCSTEPVLGGVTRNPWDPGLSVGGSSGGAAAAVASGMVPLAHASDGAGSIRIPASNCGLVGLKPSRGVQHRARGAHVIEDLIATDLLLGRTTRDVAAGYVASGGQQTPTALRRLRIALALDSLDEAPPHPEVAAEIRRTAARCIELGHDVVEARYPFPPVAVATAFRVLWSYLGGEAYDAARLLGGGRPLQTIVEPWTIGLAEWRDQVPVAALEAAFATMSALPAQCAAFFAQYDAVLSPVTRDPPPPVGTLDPTRPFAELSAFMFAYCAYTPVHNLAGIPAISLPLSSGTAPIGSMFAAGTGQDSVLIALAAELEEADGWPRRWPEMTRRQWEEPTA